MQPPTKKQYNNLFINIIILEFIHILHKHKMSLFSFLIPSNSIQDKIQYIPIGFRCSTANILKKMEIYNVNLPFDDLISSISSIKECIENNFVDFLIKPKCEKIYTKTFPCNEKPCEIIYDETFLANKKYQPYTLQYPLNNYQCKSKNNSFIYNNECYQDYKSCVEQFRRIFYSKENKIFVYISPLYSMEELYKQYDEIVREIIEFQSFLENKLHKYNSSLYNLPRKILSNNKYKTGSLFFIMVKNELESKPYITVIKKSNVNKQYDYKIILLQTNADFVDFGTTFTGQYLEEQYLIETNITAYQTSYFNQN